MAEKLTIKFSATGDKALIASINALNAATIRLLKKNKDYELQAKKLENANKKLGTSFFWIKS